MANRINTNPMVFDSVTSAVENEKLSGMHYITRAEWVGNEVSGRDIAAADDMLVTNAAGVDCYSKRAISDGDDYTTGKMNPPDVVVGVIVAKLDGGVLKIWKSPEMG